MTRHRVVAFDLEHRPHAQRFALLAENIDPCRWRYVLVWDDNRRYDYGDCPWRWLAIRRARRRARKHNQQAVRCEQFTSQRLPVR